MIWDSVEIMTVIDLIVIFLTAFALWNIYKNRQLLKHLNLLSGSALMLVGLVLIASFYAADILVMHLLPLFISEEEAKGTMQILHLGYNWIISTAGVSLIVASIVYFNRVLFPKIMQMEEGLRNRAALDGLTNIFNRSKFDEIIEKEIGRAKRYNKSLSLAIFDVDNFKKVNDTYGHLFGDYVLKTIVSIAKDNIRGTDYLIRWGGEEFMMTLPETGLERAEALAERIKNKIENYNFDNVGKITASFGVTKFNKEDSVETFIKRADDALYKAKKNGRNRVEVYS